VWVRVVALVKEEGFAEFFAVFVNLIVPVVVVTGELLLYAVLISFFVCVVSLIAVVAV